MDSNRHKNNDYKYFSNRVNDDTFDMLIILSHFPALDK